MTVSPWLIVVVVSALYLVCGFALLVSLWGRIRRVERERDGLMRLLHPQLDDRPAAAKPAPTFVRRYGTDEDEYEAYEARGR